MLPVLRALAPLFALIIAGFLLRRKATVLHVAHVPILNGLVINVTLPALIFLALIKAPAMPPSYVRLPVMLFLAEIGTMAAAWLLGRALKLPRASQGMLMMVGVFGNTAFLGYPIVLSLMPHSFPAAVMLDEFGMVIVMYVCAALIASAFGLASETDARWHEGLVKFACGPIFLSIVAAMLVRLVPLSHMVTSMRYVHGACDAAVKSLSYLAQGTTPLILLSVGAALKPRLAMASPKPIALPCLFKLVVCPLAMWALCRSIGLSGDMMRVGLLQASMPSGILASVLCAESGLEGALAGGVVFATTALSVVTIPLVVTFLH